MKINPNTLIKVEINEDEDKPKNLEMAEEVTEKVLKKFTACKSKKIDTTKIYNNCRPTTIVWKGIDPERAIKIAKESLEKCNEDLNEDSLEDEVKIEECKAKAEEGNYIDKIGKGEMTYVDVCAEEGTIDFDQKDSEQCLKNMDKVTAIYEEFEMEKEVDESERKILSVIDEKRLISPKWVNCDPEEEDIEDTMDLHSWIIKMVMDRTSMKNYINQEFMDFCTIPKD